MRKTIVVLLVSMCLLISQCFSVAFAESDDLYEASGTIEVNKVISVEDGEHYILTVEDDSYYRFELNNIWYFEIEYLDEDNEVVTIQDDVVFLESGVKYWYTPHSLDSDNPTLCVKKTSLYSVAFCEWGAEDSPSTGGYSEDTYYFDDDCICKLYTVADSSKGDDAITYEWEKKSSGSKSWTRLDNKDNYIFTQKNGTSYCCTVTDGSTSKSYTFEPLETSISMKNFVPEHLVDSSDVQTLSYGVSVSIKGDGWIKYVPTSDNNCRIKIVPKYNDKFSSGELCARAFDYYVGDYENGYAEHAGSTSLFCTISSEIEYTDYVAIGECEKGKPIYIYIGDGRDEECGISGFDEMEVSISSTDISIYATKLIDGDYFSDSLDNIEEEHTLSIDTSESKNPSMITYKWYISDDDGWVELGETSNTIQTEAGLECSYKCVVSDGNETLDLYYLYETEGSYEIDFIPAEDVDKDNIRPLDFNKDYTIGFTEAYEGVWYKVKSQKDIYNCIISGKGTNCIPEARVYVYDEELKGYILTGVTSFDGGNDNYTFTGGAKIRPGSDYYIYVCAMAGDRGAKITFSANQKADDGINGTRIFGSNRYETAFKAAEELKSINGLDCFETIVVACGTDFPDALTGCYLAEKKNAPMLLVGNDTSSEKNVVDYIKENLESGGTVYILGGTGVVSTRFEKSISSQKITVKRLAGANRYDTNIAILDEAGVDIDSDLIVCTGNNYADSLSASATGKPILMAGNTLSKSQKEYLESLEINELTTIGGPGVVSDSVVESIKKNVGMFAKSTRVYGANRYETSVKIAEKYFGNQLNQPYVVLAYAQNFPDGLSGGPIAYSLGVPMLLVTNDSYQAAAKYCTKAEVYGGIAMGGTSLISNGVIKAMEANAPEI